MNNTTITIVTIFTPHEQATKIQFYITPPPGYLSSKLPSIGEVSTTQSHNSSSSATASGLLVKGSSSDLTNKSTMAIASASHSTASSNSSTIAPTPTKESSTSS